MARALRLVPLVVVLLAAPLAGADLWIYRHDKPTFTVGVPNGWEEVVVQPRQGSQLIATLRDPITRDKPVPSRLDLYALRLPARAAERGVAGEELRISPYKPSPGESYRVLQEERLEVNGYPAALVVGEISGGEGRDARRIEMGYRGVRYLYAAVYTVPAEDFAWLEGRLRASLDSFRGRDVPRNPWAAWGFGVGGLALLAFVLVAIHRWYRG